MGRTPWERTVSELRFSYEKYLSWEQLRRQVCVVRETLVGTTIAMKSRYASAFFANVFRIAPHNFLARDELLYSLWYASGAWQVGDPWIKIQIYAAYTFSRNYHSDLAYLHSACYSWPDSLCFFAQCPLEISTLLVCSCTVPVRKYHSALVVADSAHTVPLRNYHSARILYIKERKGNKSLFNE